CFVGRRVSLRLVSKRAENLVSNYRLCLRQAFTILSSVFLGRHACRPIELSRIFEAFTIGSYSAKQRSSSAPMVS
ncbi:MAG: hypothetical protein WCB22_09060, partial [Pseudolabrys sp.]